MSDAALQVRKAVLAKLKATAAVTGLVTANKIFTYSTPGAAKPYISIGPIQVLPDKAHEYDGGEVSIQVDAYSSGPEQTEALKLGRAILLALDETELELVDDQRLIEIVHEDTRYLSEEGGLTVHAAVSFTAKTEPTD